MDANLPEGVDHQLIDKAGDDSQVAPPGGRFDAQAPNVDDEPDSSNDLVLAQESKDLEQEKRLELQIDSRRELLKRGLLEQPLVHQRTVTLLSSYPEGDEQRLLADHAEATWVYWSALRAAHQQAMHVASEQENTRAWYSHVQNINAFHDAVLELKSELDKQLAVLPPMELAYQWAVRLSSTVQRISHGGVMPFEEMLSRELQEHSYDPIVFQKPNTMKELPNITIFHYRSMLVRATNHIGERVKQFITTEPPGDVPMPALSVPQLNGVVPDIRPSAPIAPARPKAPTRARVTLDDEDD